MKKGIYCFLLLLITFGTGSSFFATRIITKVYAQARDQKQRQINKFDYGDEPVELADMKAGGLNVASGKKFNKEKDWLRDFSVTFRNSSDKPIVYLKLALDFPETKSSGSNTLRFPLTYGFGRYRRKWPVERESPTTSKISTSPILVTCFG